MKNDRIFMPISLNTRENDLISQGGKFGMIVSNKFLRANYGRNVREQIRKVATVKRIVDLAGLPVFRGATVRTIVIITDKGRKNSPAIYSPPLDKSTFLAVETGSASLETAVDKLAYEIEQESLGAESWSLNRTDFSRLIARLQSGCVPLAEFISGQICMGIKSGLTEAFVIDGAMRWRSSQRILRRPKSFAPSYKDVTFDDMQLSRLTNI